MAEPSYMMLPQRNTDHGPHDTANFDSRAWRKELEPSRYRHLVSLCKSLAVTIFRTLNFSFLNPSESREELNISPRNDGGIRTDWLDGMRGVASFVVFLFHHTLEHHNDIKWGYNAQENRTSIFYLPIVRLLFSGAAMVAIFFVVSGYALSVAHLMLIRQKNHNQLLQRLSSSVFRRAIRLYYPSFISAFIFYLCRGFNLFKDIRSESFDTKTFFYQLVLMIDPLNLDEEMGWPFNGNLWTIPKEFRGSLLLFVTLLGLARSRPNVRMATVAGLYIFFLGRGRWDMSAFMAGVLLAESNILIQQPNADMDPDVDKQETTARWFRNRNRITRYIVNGAQFILLILGLLVLSEPEAGGSPLYEWMPDLGLNDRWLGFRSRLVIGATMTIAAISFMPRCQAVFETKPARYLGRISFGLYLTHNAMNHLVGIRILDFMWSIIGRDSWIQFNGAWLLGTLIYIPLVVWVADVFWRLVDIKAVGIARRVEQFCRNSL